MHRAKSMMLVALLCSSLSLRASDTEVKQTAHAASQWHCELYRFIDERIAARYALSDDYHNLRQDDPPALDEVENNKPIDFRLFRNIVVRQIMREQLCARGISPDAAKNITERRLHWLKYVDSGRKIHCWSVHRGGHVFLGTPMNTLLRTLHDDGRGDRKYLTRPNNNISDTIIDLKTIDQVDREELNTHLGVYAHVIASGQIAREFLERNGNNIAPLLDNAVLDNIVSGRYSPEETRVCPVHNKVVTKQRKFSPTIASVVAISGVVVGAMGCWYACRPKTTA